MTDLAPVRHAAVEVALAAPVVLLVVVLVAALAPRHTERVIRAATGLAMSAGVGALAIALAATWALGRPAERFTLRTWFSTSTAAFSFDLILDAWSLAFALHALVIAAVVGAFSARYLHREPGFVRYFVLFALFVLGVLCVALAGSTEVLFTGWELLGLSSALLVAFFHERRATAQSAFRVFAVYRVSDAAMLLAAVLIHHHAGSGALTGVFLRAAASSTTLGGSTATAVALLLLVAAAGKSALLPFSGWLPRAMEGPTPSSAVYYGALSVHAGTYLLWRASPLLDESALARAVTLAVGLASAGYAAVVGRAQTDVKSALSFATLTQVGLIVVEIALGFSTLAFVHMAGNMSLRLLQFLSAPSALEDLAGLAAPAPPPASRSWPRLHLVARERGFVDELVRRAIVAPFLAVVGVAARVDRRLGGEADDAGPPGAGGGA